MKWPFTSIVMAFACLSFASSAPMVLDDTAAMMYPAYPYMPYEGLNFDIGKLFRKAASSVKHFYSYVNSWIFRKSGNQYWKEQQNVNNSQNQSINNPARVHIEAFKVYKDGDGRVIIKNIPNIPNLSNLNALNKIPLSQNPRIIGPFVLNDNLNALMQDPSQVVKKDSPNDLENVKMNLQNIILNNPFRWNEKLANDQTLGKSADRIIVHPIMVRLQREIPLTDTFGGLFKDPQLHNIIAQHMQYQGKPKEEPKSETNVAPQATETPEAPNQPAEEPAKQQVNEETKAPAADEKQDDNDQDDDNEGSDDDLSDEPSETISADSPATEAPQNEPSTKEQPKNSDNQANANAPQNPIQNGNSDSAKNVKPAEQPNGAENIFVQGANQDDLDTIRKVLAMVQPQNDANNQNDDVMHFRW